MVPSSTLIVTSDAWYSAWPASHAASPTTSRVSAPATRMRGRS